MTFDIASSICIDSVARVRVEKNPLLRHCNKHRPNRVSGEVLPPEQENPQVNESVVRGAVVKTKQVHVRGLPVALPTILPA